MSTITPMEEQRRVTRHLTRLGTAGHLTLEARAARERAEAELAKRAAERPIVKPRRRVAQ